jgi:hypothetical protein
MAFMTKYLLGTKSSVYKAAQQEELRFKELFSSVLLSGLCASMAYDQLAGTDPAGEDTGISTEKMDAAIKAMYEPRKGENGEKRDGEGKITSEDDIEIVRSAIARMMRGNKRKDFVDVALGHHLVSLNTIGKYYDADEGEMGFLEKLFTGHDPKTEKKTMENAARITEKSKQKMGESSGEGIEIEMSA